MSPVLRLQVLVGICLTVLHKDAYYRYVRKRPTEAEISTVMAELGRRGGPAKQKKMTPEERSAACRKAANARWAKREKANA